MNKHAVRMTRLLSLSTVALFTGTGCSDMFEFGANAPAAAARPAVAARTAETKKHDDGPYFFGDGAAAKTAAAAPAAKSAEAAFGAPGGDVGGGGGGGGSDTLLASTEPRWNGESEGQGGVPDVNVFGEMKGAPKGAFKPAGKAGYQQHTEAEEGEDSDVAVSPDGKWIAFTSTRHNVAGDIYLQRVDGTAVTQLTNDAAKDAYPAFSPDGKWLAFASTRGGTWQIYRMDLDGRNTVQVTSGPMQCVHPSFSAEGTRLVYSALGSRSDQWELWTVNLLTDEKRQIGYGLFPTWSPDKTVDRIAYQRARQRGSRWFSLWTMEIEKGEGRRNTEVAVSSNAAIVSPCWSPDGKKLAFSTVVQPAPGGAATKGQEDIWMIDADGANRHRLTDGNGTNLQPAWAADNRVYFVSNRGGGESVWSVQAEAFDAFTASARAAGLKVPGTVEQTQADSGKKQDPFQTADTREASGH
jgi:TolB protein